MDATPPLNKTTPPLKGKSEYWDTVGTGGLISGLSRRNRDGWQLCTLQRSHKVIVQLRYSVKSLFTIPESEHLSHRESTVAVLQAEREFEPA